MDEGSFINDLFVYKWAHTQGETFWSTYLLELGKKVGIAALRAKG